MCLRPASPILLQAKENAFILLPQRALLNTLTSLSVTPQFTIRKSVKGDLLIKSAMKMPLHSVCLHSAAEVVLAYYVSVMVQLLLANHNQDETDLHSHEVFLVSSVRQYNLVQYSHT